MNQTEHPAHPGPASRRASDLSAYVWLALVAANVWLAARALPAWLRGAPDTYPGQHAGLVAVPAGMACVLAGSLAGRRRRWVRRAALAAGMACVGAAYAAA